MAKKSEALKWNQKASLSSALRKHSIKISVVGDISVGKTALITRYVHDHFDPTLPPTIGGVAYNKSTTFIDCIFDWHIWDIAGGLDFRNMIPNYFRGCEVFILMFDITRKESFDNIPDWMAQIENAVNTPSEKLVFIICGGKQDLAEERTVSETDAKCLAKEMKASYVETSAKLGTGISEMFRIIARRLRTIKTQDNQSGKDIETTSVVQIRHPQSQQERPSSKCC